MGPQTPISRQKSEGFLHHLYTFLITNSVDRKPYIAPNLSKFMTRTAIGVVIRQAGESRYDLYTRLGPSNKGSRDCPNTLDRYITWRKTHSAAIDFALAMSGTRHPLEIFYEPRHKTPTRAA